MPEIHAPTSSDEIAVLTRYLRDLSPAMIDALITLAPILRRIDDNESSGMLHIVFERGKATDYRVDFKGKFE